MSVGDFTDKAHGPTPEEISEALGSRRPLWDELVGLLSGVRGIKVSMAFYGKSYGWALRFRRGGRALVSLYPGQGRLTAQVVLPLDLTDTALALDSTGSIRRAVAAANPYTEGRWLFLPLDSSADVLDLKKLLELRLGRALDWTGGPPPRPAVRSSRARPGQ
jgi:hypothetical protein